jgi:pyruvate/2-oxoglutarate dehydrogenase complex dihydrolipoamide acyltransferase (E2) component
LTSARFARRAAEAAATIPMFSAARACSTSPDVLGRVAAALREVPGVNAAWRDGEVVLGDEVKVAVALPGPVFPVLGSYDDLRARDPESFTAAELAGTTFTVWGLGLQLDWLTPLVMPRQGAGLGVGRAGLTLVWDARAVSPEDAAAFLQRL